MNILVPTPHISHPVMELLVHQIYICSTWVDTVSFPKSYVHLPSLQQQEKPCQEAGSKEKKVSGNYHRDDHFPRNGISPRGMARERLLMACGKLKRASWLPPITHAKRTLISENTCLSHSKIHGNQAEQFYYHVAERKSRSGTEMPALRQP